MKLERFLKKGENLEGVFPEVIQAFNKHPEEISLEIMDVSGNRYEITRFDKNVYELLSPELRSMFLGILFQYQSCREHSTPNLFVSTLTTLHKEIRLQERLDYNRELAEKYVNRKNNQ